MILQLHISDATYQRLMGMGHRIQGTIGLISPTEANFNEHHAPVRKSKPKYACLKHGKVSVGAESVKLLLTVKLDEENITPADILRNESFEASMFVDHVFEKKEV